MTTKARSRIWGKSDSKAHAGLGFPVVSAGDVGSIPGQGTKISRTTQQVQKIKKKQKNKKTKSKEQRPFDEASTKAMATHSSTLAWKIPWTERSLVGYSP